MSIVIVLLSSKSSLNFSALTCTPFLSKLYSFESNPSATILSLTLTFNFKKASLSCSIAIFNLTPFKKETLSIEFLNSIILFDGTES